MVKKTFDYKDAEEKLVNTTILFADGSSLYYDEAKTSMVAAEAYLDLFLAGITIVADDKYVRPTECDGITIKAGETTFGA